MLLMEGAGSNALKLKAIVSLDVSIGYVSLLLPFVVAESLAVDLLLGILFVEKTVAFIEFLSQRLALHRGGALSALLKIDGALRFCVEHRRLKKTTLSDAYSLPRVYDCIDSLGHEQVFSTLGCSSVHW